MTKIPIVDVHEHIIGLVDIDQNIENAMIVGAQGGNSLVVEPHTISIGNDSNKIIDFMIAAKYPIPAKIEVISNDS